MTFPLDLFITPSPQVGIRNDGSGMRMFGEAGEMMQRERLQKMQQAQAEAHFQQNQAMQRDELKSLDRYRNDQIDARKQAMTDREEAKRTQRIQTLLDQVRKTKPGSPERKMIIQELTSLGQAVSEEDTDLPEVAAAPPALSPLDIAPNAPGKEDQFGLEAPEPQGDPAPMDFGALGIPAEPPKKRGGKFLVRDEKGNLVMSYDEPAEKSRNRDSMRNIMGPLVKGARSPEEKAAAEAGLDAAVGAMDSGGYTVKEAADRGEKAYNDMMGRYKMERRPGSIPTGGGGTSRQEQTRQGQVFGEMMKVVGESRMQEAVTAARKEMSNVENMDDLLNQAENEGNNYAGNQALMEEMRKLIGASQTSQEIKNALGGAGRIVAYERDLNQWTKGGQMPIELIRGMKTANAARRKIYEKRLAESAQATYDLIMDSKGLMNEDEKKQNAEAARNFIIGRKPAAAAPPEGGGDKAAGRARAEQWLKSRRGGK